MNSTRNPWPLALLVGAASLFAAPGSWADAITDCDAAAGQIVTDARLGPPPANRVMAIVHTAAYEAANAITRRYPAGSLQLEAPPGASVDAAIAAASHATLGKLVSSQQTAIDAAYQAALAKIPDGEAKSAGIVVGERAAAAVLASRADDGGTLPESYRPHTAPGRYVPTVLPAVSAWPQRKPWLMTSAAQFRPGPPPALTSQLWARDYNEIKALGGKSSTQRSAEQTAIAGFWEASLPPIYGGLVRSVATMPGRDVMRNARLYVAVAQATDDALIAVFDAKYQYNFWRPLTAIRNGDMDGNDATERDPTWVPFIETPMHPEYPCAHCTVAGAVGTVLQAEIGAGAVPTLTTNSTSAKGAARTWTTIDGLVQEVSNARVYDGVHYRNSTEVGTALGKKVGELAVAKYLKPLP